VQGSNTWTLAGTTCGTPTLIAGMSHGTTVLSFSDGLGGIVPGTTYLYRVTALAATGEVGIGTVAWQAPAAATIRWLSATAVGSTVTLKWRYEPPAANASPAPHRFRLTAPYGLTQLTSNFCGGVGGCSLVVAGVPSGTHQFTVTGEWPVLGSAGDALTSATTVLVP
jgi:hypothetical protein